MSDNDTEFSESDYDYTEVEVLEIWERNTRYAEEHGHYPRGPVTMQETTTHDEPTNGQDSPDITEENQQTSNNTQHETHGSESENHYRYLTEQNKLLWEELLRIRWLLEIMVWKSTDSDDNDEA
jgi:hypothetical protein